MWEPKCWLWFKFKKFEKKTFQFSSVWIHCPKNQCIESKIIWLQASIHDPDNCSIPRYLNKKIINLPDIYDPKTNQIQINDQKIKVKCQFHRYSHECSELF